MYCEFFGFKENPFKITPDPRYIFLSKNHQEAFAHLLYGIQQHSGFIEIIGEVGSGKTTILRTLLNQLDDKIYRVALIFNPCLSAQELLSSINREYGIPADNLSIAALINELNRFLLQENSAGRTVVLVIDEAQNLDPHVLEQVRLISNLETESDKLIQIVLAGQPELARLLNDPRLRQLSQRITVRYQLLPMDYEDTCSYISHRMELSGGWKAATFEPGALKKIFAFSGGLPRLVNVACDRALLIAFTGESRTVSRKMAADAIAEVSKRKIPARTASRKNLAAAAVAVALLAAALALPVVRKAPERINDTTAPKTSAPAAAGLQAPVTRRPVTPEERAVDALRTAMANSSERGSCIDAFNVLAKRWQARPIKNFGGTFTDGNLRQVASRRGLRLTPVVGTVEEILAFDMPAILQVSLPGMQGYRYVAVTSRRTGGVMVETPASSISPIPLDFLQKFASGRGYIVWRNHLEIPTLSVPDTKGEQVRLLQQLMQRTGTYGGRLNGIFDQATIDAVKRFQSSRHLAADGVLSDRTLILLYRDAGVFPVPRLHRKPTGEAA